MHKRVGYTELLSSKLRSDKLHAQLNSTRLAKLKSFLDQHEHTSQWSTCVAALVHALRHNITPTSEMLCDALRRCGGRGKLDVARSLYTDFYRELGKPRSKEVHVAYMAACADCGDFSEAHKQFVFLRRRDADLLVTNKTHAPIVSSDLTSEYLRAALMASARRHGNHEITTSHGQGKTNGGRLRGTSSEVGHSVCTVLPWALALETFIAVRMGSDGLRDHNALTPVMVERVARLWELSGDWAKCLRFLCYCGRKNIFIPPEAHDAAIRVCYRHGRHLEVMTQMHQMVASRSPPDERSVHQAIISCEEVTSMERSALKQHHEGWSLAVTLFDAMRNNGVVMYQQNYESPLRSCAMAGRWDDAMRILDVMRRDNRPVSAQVYRLVVAARIEACSSFEEAQCLAKMPVMQNGGIILYLALLRCCMRRRDWKNFDRLNKEMRERNLPETFDKMRLLIQTACMRGEWYSALMRFARFENIAGHEQRRVEQDAVVRLYPEDFDMPDVILHMVLDAYEHVKDHKDPVVHFAYQSALKRKARGTAQLAFSCSHTAATPPQEWMFSRAVRTRQAPQKFV